MHNQTLRILPYFLCDAISRQWLKQIKSHAGFGCCERCIQRGDKIEGRIVLSKLNSKKRTDDSFRTKQYESHHVGTSPLLQLPVNIIELFPLDYMHLLCLGVSKRLLKRVKSSKSYSIKCSLSPSQIAKVEEIILSWHAFIPKEFPRKFQAKFKHLSHWKASEYRLMMLYTGVVFFSNKELFSDEVFENYKYLVCATRLLLGDEPSDLKEIRKMLKSFVQTSINVYGQAMIAYNYHSVIHLADDYELHGNLENVSAFCFESYLGQHIKAAVRAPHHPAMQIAQHVLEINGDFSPENDPENEFKIDEIIQKQTAYGLKSNEKMSKDNCIKLVDGQIGFVTKLSIINGALHAVCKLFVNVLNFFEKPVVSSSVGIVKVNIHSLKDQIVNFNNIERKVMILPYNSHEYVSIAFLHCIKD